MKTKEQNLYEFLEVKETMTLKELKQAYKNKILEYQPNINSVATSTKVHEIIYKTNVAYVTLRNIDLRQEYDKTLKIHQRNMYESYWKEDYEYNEQLEFISFIQILYRSYADFKSSYDFEMTKEEITLFENILLLFENILEIEKEISKTKKRTKHN